MITKCFTTANTKQANKQIRGKYNTFFEIQN